MTETRFVISTFESITATAARHETVTWAELAQRLTKHAVVPDKTAAACWSPARFDPPIRRGEHVVEVALLAVDLDSATPEVLQQIAANLRARGLAYASHSTWSHTPERPRWRIVVPLSRPVPAAEWASFWSAANAELFLGAADPSTKDPARIFFLPSHPPGARGLAVSRPGRPLDPAELPAPERNGQEAGDGEPAYRALLDGVITEGERNVTLTSLAGVLRRGGADEGVIMAVLRAVNGGSCQPPLPEAEVRAIARSVARYTPQGANRFVRVYTPPDGQIEFRSAAELGAEAPEVTPWLWRGYVAEGSLTVLGAREKSGKSTLAFALIRALLDGQPFLGQPTTPTAVVYVSEEAPQTVVEKLDRFGLQDERERLSILTRTPTRPGLAVVVPAAVAEAQRIGAKLLVIDSMSWWAALPPEAENDAGAVQQAVEPLLAATAQGVAVLVLHHVDKENGELRGSTALGAVADIIITLRRDPSAPERRRLEATGRFQATPESVLIELRGNAYVALGTPAAVCAQARDEQVLAALAVEEPLTLDQITARTGLPKQRVAEALRRLVARGDVTRTGRGTRGEPHRYQPAQFDLSAEGGLYRKTELQDPRIHGPYSSTHETNERNGRTGDLDMRNLSTHENSDTPQRCQTLGAPAVKQAGSAT